MIRCSATHCLFPRRFGVPQARKPDDSGKAVLTGYYGSIGILLRSIVDRVSAEGSYTPVTLSILSRIAAHIGKPLTITRKQDPDKKKETEISYNEKEMSALLALCAPPFNEIETNGGKYTRAEYLKKDPTYKPDFDKYGQSLEEVAEQKKVLKEKREKVKKEKKWDSDHARYFHIALPTGETSKKDLITRVSLEDLKRTNLLEHKTLYLNESEKTGLRIAISGGSSHNKLAAKKFWGSDWKNHPMLKGDVVLICTGSAPLDISEYMEPDSDWLSRCDGLVPGTNPPVSSIPVTVSNSKKRKNSGGDE